MFCGPSGDKCVLCRMLKTDSEYCVIYPQKNFHLELLALFSIQLPLWNLGKDSAPVTKERSMCFTSRQQGLHRDRLSEVTRTS